jgi:hypothetical protein
MEVERKERRFLKIEVLQLSRKWWVEGKLLMSGEKQLFVESTDEDDT